MVTFACLSALSVRWSNKFGTVLDGSGTIFVGSVRSLIAVLNMPYPVLQFCDELYTVGVTESTAMIQYLTR